MGVTADWALGALGTAGAPCLSSTGTSVVLTLDAQADSKEIKAMSNAFFMEGVLR
jgi:hypothetical protein